MNDLERLAFELRLPSGSKPTLGAREIFERVRRRLVERYNEPDLGQVEKGHIQTVLKVLVRSVKADFVEPSLRVDREEAARICELLAPWLSDPLESDPSKRDGVTDSKTASFEQLGAPRDGLFSEERCFIWGGERFERLTAKMIDVLGVLVDAYVSGFPVVDLPTIRQRTGHEFDGGFVRQTFRVKRKGEEPIHPVASVIERVADGEYRLKVPRAV